MSESVRVRIDVARRVAHPFSRWLATYCERLLMVGSVRRKRETVGDLEFVCVPRDVNQLWAGVEMAVHDGRMRWHQYRGANGKYAPKMGNKYRGVDVPLTSGDWLQVEIFVADEHNVGYQEWLRTGPGDANQVIMSALSWRDKPFRARGGYWHYEGQRVSIPHERVLFECVGLPYMLPEDRCARAYRRVVNSKDWRIAPRDFFESLIIDESVDDTPTQMSLF